MRSNKVDRSLEGSSWRVCQLYLTVLSLATLRLCLKHSMPARFRSGSGELYVAMVHCAGSHPEALVDQRVKKAHRTWLASEMDLADSQGSSVTSRSWKVRWPVLPDPSPPETREDLLHPKLCHRTTELGRRRRLMRPGTYLKTAWRSLYGLKGTPQRRMLLHEEEIAMSVPFMAKQC